MATRANRLKKLQKFQAMFTTVYYRTLEAEVLLIAEDWWISDYKNENQQYDFHKFYNSQLKIEPRRKKIVNFRVSDCFAVSYY